MKVLKKVLTSFLVLMFALSVCGCGGASKSTKKPAKPKTYAEADINILISDAKENAAAATKNYKGKDVKIINGTISNIESNASYISLNGKDKFSMLHVQCFTNGNKELKDKVTSLKKGQKVTVYGNIKDVGEIMGYSVNIDKIE